MSFEHFSSCSHKSPFFLQVKHNFYIEKKKSVMFGTIMGMTLVIIYTIVDVRNLSTKHILIACNQKVHK